ncbi:hypothetical protein SUGI_0042860 [Cryptomeria japonica]|uniref:F-box/kelch-repeat protein At1g15670-like n=1 Tax=Cryptomeria japonica TaxID=3369 RepID=UPI00240896F4|nr:F-box/kelch-repeat protein At1g15670-like [Cryptomeria japonica]GLJ06604.1 hypothetical protein SUGI_0042860 [Cryptomeria japonica]
MGMGDVITSLPEEIARECLLRVPYKCHPNLMSVCRKWEAVVKSPRFYQDRKRFGLKQQFLCLAATLPADNRKEHGKRVRRICAYDLVDESCETLPPIPDFPDGIPHLSHLLSTPTEKLVVMGGWHPLTWQSLTTVFVYEFSSAQWRRGVDMPTVRSLFSCSCSSSSLIYVTGGHDDDKKALRSAEVYDVEHDRWDVLPDMKEERDECASVFIDEKLFVMSGYTTETQGRFEGSAQVFDPNTRIWNRVEDMWTLPQRSLRLCVFAFGRLYSFTTRHVMQYDVVKNQWVVVCALPESLCAVTCVTACYNGILVAGSTAGGDEKSICFMYNPVNEEWKTLETPTNLQGFIQSAAAVEI